MKTKKEAEKTLCPLLMQVVMTSPIDSHYTLEDGMCLADGCMMWRRGKYQEEVGYCGLAGNPWPATMPYQREVQP